MYENNNNNNPYRINQSPDCININIKALSSISRFYIKCIIAYLANRLPTWVKSLGVHIYTGESPWTDDTAGRPMEMKTNCAETLYKTGEYNISV